MNKQIKTTPTIWQDIYQESDTAVWKTTPHQYTEQAVALHNGNKALDLGCGEGHDAIYLASNHYQVDAIDISPVALQRMMERADINSRKISPVEQDISTITLQDSYDIIVSYGFLHFAGKDNYQQYIQHLKDHTHPGGIHAFYTFGDVGNFHDIGIDEFWFPNQQSLADLYQDWNIIKTEERTIQNLVTGDNGEKLYNSLVKILVQKPF